MTVSETTMKETVQAKWTKRPLIISGPCSAETEEQVLETAQRLAKTGKVDMLRAGIWKPRTRPGSFRRHRHQGTSLDAAGKETHGVFPSPWKWLPPNRWKMRSTSM